MLPAVALARSLDATMQEMSLNSSGASASVHDENNPFAAAATTTTTATAANPTGKFEQHELCDADFARLEVLGRGAYSTVVSARHLPSGQLVALKEIPRRQVRDLKMDAQLQSEINVHRRLRHPHIVRLLSYFVTRQDIVLVMELCPRGTLHRRLQRAPGGRFDEPRAARYARHVARALHYLHSRRIVHRDLKLENVILGASGDAKLADFGWSRELAAAAAARTTVCGTLDYLSPEMLLSANCSSTSGSGSGSGHNHATDVWSLGAMIAEMLTGAAPFYRVSERDTVDAIRFAEPALGDGVSAAARGLLLEMLRKDPALRPTMAHVLQHPWIQQQQQQPPPAAPAAAA